MDAAMAVLTLHHWDAGQEQGVKRAAPGLPGAVVIVTIDPRSAPRCG